MFFSDLSCDFRNLLVNVLNLKNLTFSLGQKFAQRMKECAKNSTAHTKVANFHPSIISQGITPSRETQSRQNVTGHTARRNTNKI